MKLQLLSDTEQNKIIDKALQEHYRETMERKRVPSDYLLMFTEGGESNAVADAIAKAQAKVTWSIAFKAGLQWARELIEDGRTHCVLNNKEQCAQCLAKLMAELNAE